MKTDFIGFEKAYAETSNREVLLNLARLQNHDQTYFFKLGQISSSYRMQASLTGTGNYVIQGTGNGGNATGGGTPGLVYENDPSFTFIPVNDETSAQLLLKPVPAETFYSLYQQGWRLDQLFRLMVDRIELSEPSSDGQGCLVETIRNVPPPVPPSADGLNSADYLREASGYVTFLRVSALVYGLQKRGHLLLRGTTTFVPFDTKSALAADASAASAAPKSSDIAAASSKGQSWEIIGKQWVLGQQVFGAKFYLNPLPDQTGAQGAKLSPKLQAIKDDVLSDNGMKELKNGIALDRVINILASGFSIEGVPGSDGEVSDSCTSTQSQGISAHLVMRSLIGLMAAAAQEEVSYDKLANSQIQIPPSQKGDPPLSFQNAVPPVERIPLLRLTHVAGVKTDAPLVEVNYRGTNYVISDLTNPEIAENQYWNRDMFRLINQLTSQVTVDISKFPLPGILQLHTN